MFVSIDQTLPQFVQIVNTFYLKFSQIVWLRYSCAILACALALALALFVNLGYRISYPKAIVNTQFGVFSHNQLVVFFTIFVVWLTIPFV